MCRKPCTLPALRSIIGGGDPSSSAATTPFPAPLLAGRAGVGRLHGGARAPLLLRGLCGQSRDRSRPIWFGRAVARRLLSRREDRLYRRPDHPDRGGIRAPGGRPARDDAAWRHQPGGHSHHRAGGSLVRPQVLRLLAGPRHRACPCDGHAGWAEAVAVGHERRPHALGGPHVVRATGADAEPGSPPRECRAPGRSPAQVDHVRSGDDAERPGQRGGRTP